MLVSVWSPFATSRAISFANRALISSRIASCLALSAVLARMWLGLASSLSALALGSSFLGMGAGPWVILEIHNKMC